jgi:exopolysaccharide biosynthesis protein
MSGSVTVMAWRSPAVLLVRVPDTLAFLYLPRNTASVDSIARRENLRCAINGSFFSGMRGDATHAGLLTLYGRPVAPTIDDRQLTHVVRVNSRARSVEFFPVHSYVPAADPRAVEFQTGPLIIDNGRIRDDLIGSSINGLTAHTRTLIATLDRKTCFFVTATDRLTLRDLASFLVRLRVFQGGRLDVINLDGGSSVALYLREATGWNYNAGDRLPILIGFP